MTIRAELESKLASFAQMNNLKVAYEGIGFDRSKLNEYLQIFFIGKQIINPTLEFQRKRTRGMVQINVCVKDGNGSKRVEELAELVAELYPAADKLAFETISIERHPQIGPAFIDCGFRIIPITVEYRQES